MSTSLAPLAARIREINAANGWDLSKPQDWTDPNRVPCLLMLITTEVSEAMEAFRKDDHANFAEELADVLIRVLDIAPGLGVDLDAEVEKKLLKNAQRGFRHGGKKV